ncbi:Carbonic anhydrase [Amphibalanus amphitrite]|uniref:carbonic anhydrase n=1 Tax=Amphibalanus amphitrite TaxID=1232801 RepID=A0A6A4WEW7_AMPAM|nr:Carbonic anhydrase [Amphibalanus amphitrite]
MRPASVRRPATPAVLLLLTLLTTVSDARFSYGYSTGPYGVFFHTARHGSHGSAAQTGSGAHNVRDSAVRTIGRSAEIRDSIDSIPQQTILDRHETPSQEASTYSSSDDQPNLTVGYAVYTEGDKHAVESLQYPEDLPAKTSDGLFEYPSPLPNEPEDGTSVFAEESEEEDIKCLHARQSPIDINTCCVQRRLTSTLRLKNFDIPPTTFNLSNTGKDVMCWATWQDRTIPTMSGAGLPGTFIPFAIDMHWATDDSAGSEHTVNGGRYPLELHIQTYNAKYDSLELALTKVDGIAVLGVLYSLDEKYGGGRGFTALTEAIARVPTAVSTVEMAAPPSMASFLPDNLSDRAQYKGSLTGAPYLEVVHWILLLTPARILAPELALLRSLQKEDGSPIGDTYRAPQDRCGRQVTRSGFRQLFEKCAYHQTDPAVRA